MLYPKIGIRPVIDGRWGGVRESLENQTMRMAENAAQADFGESQVPRWYAGAVRDRLYDGLAVVPRRPAWQSSSLPRMLRQRCL